MPHLHSWRCSWCGHRYLWAACYITKLLVNSTPKGAGFPFLFLFCSQILCELHGFILRGPNLRALYGRSWQQLIRDDMGKIPFFTLQVSCLCHSIYLVVDQEGRRQQNAWMTVSLILFMVLPACHCRQLSDVVTTTV